MKPSILLLALSVFAFSSCTTAYKSGQTPDDVYYSPTRPQEDYVQSDKEENKPNPYDDQYYDDRYLRMKVHNHYRWSDLDDWYYYDQYSIGYNYYYGSYYNPYNSWNYYYNPYCCCHHTYFILDPKTPVALPTVKPRFFSLAGYNNNGYNNSNGSTGTVKLPIRTTTKTGYNNSNGLSNKIRTIFSNDNPGGSTRSYSPSSGSSGNNNSGHSSGGSNKSGGSVSRPVRN